MSYTEWFCEDLQDLLDLTPKKDVLFIIGLFLTPWTAAYQAPPSMGFVRQEYWSGVPLPSSDLAAAAANTFCMTVRKMRHKYLKMKLSHV